MKTVIMGRDCFVFLQEAKAIKQAGVNYKLGQHIVIVDGKRKGYKFELSDK